MAGVTKLVRLAEAVIPDGTWGRGEPCNPGGRQNSNWAQSPRKALSGAALRGHFHRPHCAGDMLSVW